MYANLISTNFPHLFCYVTGFSVGGHVVDGYGAGIEGAKVIVDGQLRAVTDNLGYYRLDQVLLSDQNFN